MSFPGDLAQQLLTCLHAELDAGPAPIPADKVCLRAGETIPISAGTAENEACGVAWVRVVGISPAQVLIPGGADSEPNCAASAWQIELEMAAVRCLPYGTVAAGPSCDEWTAAALLMDADAAAMRRALCCFTPVVTDNFPVAAAAPGAWVPHGPEGGALWSTQSVLVTLDCSEC
ncbi:hypothetical protein [Streptomyces sp. NPDC087525]|uniref:hypothetical protein n=1 Tax=Streptomyces sp. NPDC087525 TaxID=3365793 RepID=UPI003809E73B